MSEIQIYKSVENEIEIEVKFDNETVWLSQDELSILFQRDQSVISRHIKNVFEEELTKESNMHFLHIPNSDKPIKIYNLDVIISVGYRVKSKQGTQFRQWATQRLKDYLIIGQAINFMRFEKLKKLKENFKKQIEDLGVTYSKLENIFLGNSALLYNVLKKVIIQKKYKMSKSLSNYCLKYSLFAQKRFDGTITFYPKKNKKTEVNIYLRINGLICDNSPNIKFID